MCWSIEYNPNRRRLVSAGEDGLVHLWNVGQPERPELLTSFEHGGKAMTVAFSPNGKHLFSAGEGGKIKLWNLEDKAQVTTLTSPLPYEGLNISGVTGITEAQRLNLLSLGAIETSA
jgi:WD40 repeat protein